MTAKTTKKRVVRAWAVLDEKTARVVEQVFRYRQDAVDAARDVSFMGSRGEPQKVIPCTITYSLPTPASKRSKV